jgi:hypothetical protein
MLKMPPTATPQEFPQASQKWKYQKLGNPRAKARVAASNEETRIAE